MDTPEQTGSIDLSIVIVSWNVSRLLRQLLVSIFQESRRSNFEVFVVDNASDDGSAEMVATEFPQVRLIANTVNAGFARANNQAITLARGKLILFLNPDTRLTSDIVQPIVAVFQADERLGALAGQIYGQDGRRQRSIRRDPSATVLLLLMLKVQAIWPRWRPLARYYALDFDYARAAAVEQVMGACFAVRQAALDQLKNFDARYFLWFEEVDLCRRLRLAGWSIWYRPEISVIHYGGESFGQLMNIKQQLIFNRSLLTYTLKHQPIWTSSLVVLLYLPSLLLSLIEPLARKFITPKTPV